MDSSIVGSKQELDIVRRSRQACTEKLEVLQDEIRGLRCEAELLEVQIHRLDVALGPHNKLPPEMLLRIFELCCEGPAQIPAQNGSIYTISHVCSLWRQIALSIPEFWASVSIKLNADSERQLQIAEQWLSRAGNHPRYLKFMEHAAGGLSMGESLLRKLVIHYPCRELHLYLPRTQVTRFTEWLNGPFSDHLEVLDIDFSRTLWDESWPNLFAIAPTTRLKKLLHVRLAGMCDFQNIMTVIPWNQLQYLTLLLWRPYSDCLDILSECASLVRCCIYVTVDDSPVATARRPITLPALRVLRLFFRSPNSWTDSPLQVEKMIQFLSVPSLSHLTLGQKVTEFTASSADLGGFGCPVICELFQRSNGMPDLVSLDLGLETSVPINVRALLTNTPRLRSLHVRTGIFGKEDRNDIATGTLAPQLRSIMTEAKHEVIDILRMVELRHRIASKTLVDKTKQVAEFSNIVFSCYSHPRGSQSTAFKRLARIKKAAPRLSINLSFD
ncbi:hypothetical protein JOM56_001814 [Amanita muscaria]